MVGFMVPDGKKRCRATFVLLTLGLIAGLSACSTVKKTFDMTPDPELQRPGVYPNINETGAPQPGRLLTPDEQKQTVDALAAKGRQASPAIGVAAKKEVDAGAAELQKVGKTHVGDTLKDIQDYCKTAKAADATKCPQ
jgi:hypothetical protein